MFSLEIPSCYFLFPFLMDNYMVWPRNKIYNTAAIVAAAFMLVALATCSQVPYWKHKVEWDVGCHREFTFSTLSGWETIWTGSDLPCMILKWSAKSKKKKKSCHKEVHCPETTAGLGDFHEPRSQGSPACSYYVQFQGYIRWQFTEEKTDVVVVSI